MASSQRTRYLEEHKEVFFQETFCTLFHETALTYPEKAAVVCGAETCTYKELDNASNLVARLLLRSQPAPEEIVAVHMGRSIHTVACLLGIWKAGCAYVYLDDMYPQSRNDLVYRTCGCRLMLDEAALSGIHWREEAPFLDHSVAQGLALLVFTSGSTGAPKGVMLEHGSIMASISHFPVFGTSEADHLALFPGLSVVASVFDLFSCLLLGATLHIVPNEIRRDIRALAAFYRAHSITLTFLPAHMAKKLLAEPLEDMSLRLLLVGSEAVRCLKKAPFRILHIYGASELCAMASYYEITDERKEYPIGQLCSSLRGYVVDEQGVPVAPGEVGALWVSGRQLSRGYFHDTARTSEQFCTNPFAQDPPFHRIFKTNDLVRLNEQGQLTYVGRRDNMYKIRGFRVEAGQVEAALLSCHHVHEAVVKAFTDSGGCHILCGYFMADRLLDVKALKAELRQKLVYYMVPTCLFQVEDFERNLNQKIRRDAILPPAELDDHGLLEERY